MVFLVHMFAPEKPMKQLFQVVVGKESIEEDELMALTRIKNLLARWKTGEITDLKAENIAVFGGAQTKAKAKAKAKAKPKSKAETQAKAQGSAPSRRRPSADAASDPERAAQVPRVARELRAVPLVQFSDDDMSFEGPEADYGAMPIG